MRWTTWSPSSEQPDTQSHPEDPGGQLDASLVELMTRLGRALRRPFAARPGRLASLVVR